MSHVKVLLNMETLSKRNPKKLLALSVSLSVSLSSCPCMCLCVRCRLSVCVPLTLTYGSRWGVYGGGGVGGRGRPFDKICGFLFALFRSSSLTASASASYSLARLVRTFMVCFAFVRQFVVSTSRTLTHTQTCHKALQKCLRE